MSKIFKSKGIMKKILFELTLIQPSCAYSNLAAFM